MGNFSNTKLQILRMCIKTKTWTDIIEQTGYSKPTIKSHIDKLMLESLLEKTDNGYRTTSKGIEQISLRPNRRDYASQEKIPSEVHEMISDAIFPGLTLTEKLSGMFAEGLFRNKGMIKKVRLYLDDLSKIMRDSVVVWLPPNIKFEKDAYKIVNQLISKQIKIVEKFEDKGRMTIIIDFDLPLAFDNVINNEEDHEIKQKLTENRDEILETLYKNWSKLTK